MYPRNLKLAIGALAIAKPRLHRHLFGGEVKAEFDAMIAEIGKDWPRLAASERCVAALRAVVTSMGGNVPESLPTQLAEAEAALAELDRNLEWTDADQAAAAAQGWEMRTVTEGGRLHIFATEEDEELGDIADERAAGLVLDAAMVGDPLARKAIAYALCRAPLPTDA